jgi:hypothetical protein
MLQLTKMKGDSAMPAIYRAMEPHRSQAIVGSDKSMRAFRPSFPSACTVAVVLITYELKQVFSAEATAGEMSRVQRKSLGPSILREWMLWALNNKIRVVVEET